VPDRVMPAKWLGQWSRTICLEVADFRDGSDSDLPTPKSDFRSFAESGLKSDVAGGPLSAMNRHAVIQ
jgi:hypothetical protein